MQATTDNQRPPSDVLLVAIADYVTQDNIQSSLAYQTASYSLMDAIGCAILALQYPACKKLLGPIIPETIVPLGSRVPGTTFVLDPILAAFNIGTQIRWLDFNDTWLAAEWGHPSDNLGAILGVADYLSQKNIAQNKPPITIQTILTALIKAYEIQGILALENGLNRLGFDHVMFVKIASTAIATHLLGGTKEQIINALSQSFLDGPTLRAYRHAPNTGSRKSWAAGDACSRAVRLAWLTLQGELGYPSVLTAKTWGAYDAFFKGQSFKLSQPFGTYVIENILFKISFPAEFHAQTAVECAVQLHPIIKDKLEKIDHIDIMTQESAIRIIDKTGPLYNPADRDHCLQYMIAIALLKGDLKASDYEDSNAEDPRINKLRKKMRVIEEKQFSKDYLDPAKRSISNALTIYFKDGSKTDQITIHYPIGHQKRREAGVPLLFQKFTNNLSTLFSNEKICMLTTLFQDQPTLMATPINELMDCLVGQEKSLHNLRVGSSREV
ncbi:MAG: 2-methylcitrate dehydratase [Gammaproteobacteria bacterium RIFCSPHIGHO2_12_FULL_42_10]|nr:MAG: 2-methylcitrate dehydratase [Gammaproteobacteria bacterium RIFCSPHIGHO2_12_FULL_42_10]